MNFKMLNHGQEISEVGTIKHGHPNTSKQEGLAKLDPILLSTTGFGCSNYFPSSTISILFLQPSRKPDKANRSRSLLADPPETDLGPAP